MQTCILPSRAAIESGHRAASKEAYHQRFSTSTLLISSFSFVSCGKRVAYNPADMWLLHRRNRVALDDATSDVLERIQRLEREQAELRARLEGERELRILVAQIVGAAQVAPAIGSAVEGFARAMRAPIPRGRAGGLGRARTAWRYFDGTFMPESEKDEAYRDEYERYAAGGRARSAKATRNADGTFA
jgi:hypothetical protein